MGEGDSPVGIFRARSGVVGESRRQSHLVGYDPVEGFPDVVRALCGEEFARGDIEQLEWMRGMPCVGCMSHSKMPGADRLRELLASAVPELAPYIGSAEGVRHEGFRSCGD